MANQVLEIIRKRHHTGSIPRKRDDPFKIGLCVEGGGLRGIVTGGSLASLEALNLKDTIDVVYGSSSGAYSSSFFLSGNMMMGSRFFLDYSQTEFVSRKRVFRGGPLFNLSYVSEKMHNETPLNYQKVIKSETQLHLVATDAKRAHPITIKSFKTPEELDRALQASATIPPYFHPRPLFFRKHSYLDGSILDPFCINSAISEGCTHLLILFSMPWRHRHNLQIVDKKLIRPYFAKLNEHLGEMYLHHGEYSVNGLSHVWNHYDGTHILTVSPLEGSKLPGQLTTNRKRLGTGFLAGAQAVLNSFDVDDDEKKIILESFKQELHIG